MIATTSSGQSLVFVGVVCLVMCPVWFLVVYLRKRASRDPGETPDLWAGRSQWARFNLLTQMQAQSRWKGNAYVGLGFAVLGFAFLVWGIVLLAFSG